VAYGFVGEEADVVDTSVALGVVHAVADDELVGDLEGYVVGFDGDEATFRLVEAGSNLEGGWLVLEHEAAQVREGEAGVKDVFDDDDVLSLDGVVDVLDEFDGTRGDTGAAVAGDGDKVKGVVDGDGAGEVGKEDGCAFEDPDEDDWLAVGLAGVVGGNLGADLTSALGNLLFRVEDFHGGGGGEGEFGRADRHECQGSANGRRWQNYFNKGGCRDGAGQGLGRGWIYLEQARTMYPYIDIGSLHLGTFGLLLWLAAVVATVVLHKNFGRHGVDADALNVVAMVVIFGVIGAKTWHELQDIPDLKAAMRQIGAPGFAHPLDVVMGFLHWFQAGFAWFGGMLAGIGMLMWQGRSARFKGALKGTLGKRVGALRMLDLAAPAAAIGYGVGRIGCLTSGDGDYGIKTTLPWGVHMAWNALVPTSDLVQPTPLYELLFSLVVFWVIWKLGRRAWPVGWLTGLYLVLSGIGRFLVEFVRVNPRIYWGMSNAQVAALLSVVAGALLMVWARSAKVQWAPELVADSVG
jgi:phosphatidylglycerol:prolipoprotein diacylglycerol transferase